VTLTDEHAKWLTTHAVPLPLAEQLGVCSVLTQSDIPEEWRGGLGRHTPGVLLPWTSHDGRVSMQLRPDTPPMNGDGEPVKYLFRKAVEPVLWVVRPNPRAKKILIVEGSKQCLCAAEYAPLEYAVYGVAGCYGWLHDGVPIADLSVVDGCEVVVAFDADAATNLDVYMAGTRLTEALQAENATSIRWMRLPGAGKSAGLDDVMAKRPAARRQDYLERMIDKAAAKVADAKPKPKRKSRPAVVAPAGRPRIDVNEDRRIVIDALVKALVDRFDGSVLFNYGGVIARLVDDTVTPINKATFLDLVIDACTPVSVDSQGVDHHCWPDPNTMHAVLSKAEAFTPLDRITHAPFVRPGGTVCQTPGYDHDTRTILAIPESLAGIDVPMHPTTAEVIAARDLLVGDWLRDMPFPDDASRANALGLMLTPFIRGLVPLAPLAVIDGAQMGVGKNLLVDCFSILVTGVAADPKLLNPDDDENRKLILSVFRSGRDIHAFDEAHTLQGNALAHALTVETYSGRVLGVSDMAEFPNRVTWLAMGNQVQVRGDLARRVYRIGLDPNVENPQDRPDDIWLHQDPKGWTREHRAELLTACLTLVRAWFVANTPIGRATFGSFEAWQRVVGGVLAHAGVPGFLDNLKTWRSESDPVSKWWRAHLAWLHDEFGTLEFTCAQVRTAAVNSSDYQAPLNLDDVTEKGHAKKLGEAYARIKNRRYDGYSLVKTGEDRRGVAKWMVIVGGEVPGDAGTPPSLRVSEINPPRGDTHTPIYEGGGDPSAPRSPGTAEDELMIFDLETGSATELHSAGPEWLRLGGWSDGATTELTTDFAALAQRVQHAHVVTGHNVMGYDLIALARHHGLDILELTRRGAVFDTLLAARFVDPPMAREKGVDAQRRYDLDSLGRKYDLGGKTGDLKGLKKEFGGFDQIPVDDPRYREYLTGDVALSLALYRKLHEECGDSLYLRREHRVAAVAARMTMNGFRVNRELLDERLAYNARLRERCLERLHDKYGIPLLNEKDEPCASPLATRAGKDALIAALERHGVKPGSWWTTGKTSDIATGKDAMAHLSAQYHHIHEIRELCLLVAKVVTIRSVYTTVAKHLVGDRVHPEVQMRQSTGRWSLTKPGLTVMGKRGGKWHEREVFIAEPGHVIIAVDLSQVDMRAVAGLSGDAGYIEMLRAEDPHAEIARVLFGDPTMREVAKPIGHGWNYGRGVKAISNDNDLPPDVVLTFDREMRARFPRLVAWQDEVRDIAASGELLDNGFGRQMRPDPTRAHTQGPALKGQGGARDLMMTGLLRLPEYVLPMLRAQVHDEVVLSVPAADAEEIQRVVIESLSFDWEAPSGAVVPIVAEGGPTDRTSWGQVYAKDAA
jgi:DNA polymerase I-like protein with 3'-5' exonuclease and polymerase domains